MDRLEKELIPLLFAEMNLDSSSVYQRLDTGEEVSGEYIEMLTALKVVNIFYDGKGKIKTHCPFEQANAIIVKECKSPDKAKSYIGEDYAYFDEEAFRQQQESSELGSGLSVTR